MPVLCAAEAAFELFDVDGSGKVNKEEFRAGLRSLMGTSLSDITDVQVRCLLAFVCLLVLPD